MKITNKDIGYAAKVSAFMWECRKLDPRLFGKVTSQGMPFGDLAYGKALADWHKKGCPSNVFFSYARGETPCPFLMAFRKQISEHFGLEILTIEEGEERAKKTTTRTVKVHDWGLN